MSTQPAPKGAWRITFLLFLFMLVNFADKIVVGLAGVPIMTELKLEPEVLLPLMKFNAYSTAFDETVDASFKFTNAWLVREGRIPKPVPAKDVLTTSIVEKVDPKLVKWRPA